MTLSRARTRLASWAGLCVSASAWALNMLLGQMLPIVDCTRQSRYSALISSALTLLVMLAGYISWRSASATPLGFGSPATLRFDARLSALSATMFAFALALQTLASWALSGCER